MSPPFIIHVFVVIDSFDCLMAKLVLVLKSVL